MRHYRSPISCMAVSLMGLVWMVKTEAYSTKHQRIYSNSSSLFQSLESETQTERLGVGGVMRYDKLNTFCLNPSIENDLKRHFTKRALDADKWLDFGSEEFVPLQVFQHGNDKTAHWDIVLGLGTVGCVPWETEGAMGPGCAAFSEKIEQIGRVHAAIFKYFANQWERESGDIIDNIDTVRCGIYAELMDMDAEKRRIQCSKDNIIPYIPSPTTQLLKNNKRFEPILWRNLKRVISFGLNFISTNVPGIEYLNTNILKASNSMMWSWLNSLFHTTYWYEKAAKQLIKEHLKPDLTKDHKDNLENMLESAINNKFDGQIKNKGSLESLAEAARKLLILELAYHIGLPGITEKGMMAADYMTSIKKTATKVSNKENIPLDQIKNEIWNAVISYAHTHEQNWFSDEVIANMVLLSWLNHAFLNKDLYKTDWMQMRKMFNEQILQNMESIEALNCLPVFFGNIGYNYGRLGSSGSTSTGSSSEDKNNQGFLIDESFHHEYYNTETDPKKMIRPVKDALTMVQPTCARFALAQMMGWNKKDGFYSLKVVSGWFSNLVSSTKTGIKTKKVNKEIDNNFELGKLVINIPSKCLADKAWDEEQNGKKRHVDANCRMFTWCLRELIRQICPTELQLANSRDSFSMEKIDRQNSMASDPFVDRPILNDTNQDNPLHQNDYGLGQMNPIRKGLYDGGSNSIQSSIKEERDLAWA